MTANHSRTGKEDILDSQSVIISFAHSTQLISQAKTIQAFAAVCSILAVKVDASV